MGKIGQKYTELDTKLKNLKTAQIQTQEIAMFFFFFGKTVLQCIVWYFFKLQTISSQKSPSWSVTSNHMIKVKTKSRSDLARKSPQHKGLMMEQRNSFYCMDSCLTPKEQ